MHGSTRARGQPRTARAPRRVVVTLGAAAMALCVLLLPLASSLSLAAPPSCAREASVEALVACLAARMPRAGAGYVPPDAQARAEWRVLVASMLRGPSAASAHAPRSMDATRTRHSARACASGGT